MVRQCPRIFWGTCSVGRSIGHDELVQPTLPSLGESEASCSSLLVLSPTQAGLDSAFLSSVGGGWHGSPHIVKWSRSFAAAVRRSYNVPFLER
jgi:hypothetical protein